MAVDTSFSITIDDSDWDKFTKDLFDHNLPFATSVAINQTIFQAQQIVRKSMDRYYEGGPVPFTRSGILFTKSHKRDLHAMVYVNPNRGEYIANTIYGGVVKPARGRTRVRPVRMRLTKQGNISNKYSGGAGKVAKMLAKPKYFSGVPRGKAKTENNAGVWERMGRGGKQSLRMVAHYKRRWRQRPFFPADKIAERKIQQVIGQEFYKAIVRATNGRIG